MVRSKESIHRAIHSSDHHTHKRSFARSGRSTRPDARAIRIPHALPPQATPARAHTQDRRRRIARPNSRRPAHTPPMHTAHRSHATHRQCIINASSSINNVIEVRTTGCATPISPGLHAAAALGPAAKRVARRPPLGEQCVHVPAVRGHVLAHLLVVAPTRTRVFW